MTGTDGARLVSIGLSIARCEVIGCLLVMGCSPSSAPTSVAPTTTDHLTREQLDQSLDLARDYLLRQQTEEGNFHYQWHCLKGEWRDEPQAVRRAGAFWGVALMHRYRPTDRTQDACQRAFQYYRDHSREVLPGVRFIDYPETVHGETGTVALVTLALIELIRSEPSHPDTAAWRDQMRGHVEFLLRARQPNGHFASKYQPETGIPFGDPSPYFDGEALLALAKAARVLPRDDLAPLVVESAHQLYDAYGVQARRLEPDSPLTKAFYAWGTMAFLELYETGWSDTEPLATHAIELADWILDVHGISQRRRNTAYAYEGLGCAWELARRTGNQSAQKKIGQAIESGLVRLMTWQAGGPIPNEYLRQHAREIEATQSAGGVMNGEANPLLRIDVTQHQTHAMLLVRQYLYTDKP